MVMKKEAVLLLGELGSATKAEDASMYDGLAYVLRERKSSTNFTGMVVDGGLIPRLPEYYGVRDAEDMHFLGTNPEKEDSEKVRELKSKLGDIKVQHLKKKYGEFKEDREFLTAIESLGQKIVTKSEAAQVARGNLKKVISAIGIGVPLHYIEGDEDKKNKKELKELKIVNYSANKETNSKLEKKIEEREKRLGVIEDIVTALDTLKGKELKKLDIEARDVKKKLNEYLEVSTKLPEDIEAIADKLNGNGKAIIAASKINELRHLDEVIEKLRAEARDYEINDLAMLREKEASSFFRITKRRALTAQDEEVLQRLAHYEYRETLRSIAQFEIHEDRQVNLKLGNLSLMVGHNLNNDSDSPNKDALRKRMKGYDSRNEQPDANVEAHNGPLKMIVEKQDQFGDDVTVYLQLPTFQSEEKLKDCLTQGIKNWHTKRLTKGMFGSGATIISKADDGTIDLEFYDDKQLIAIGRKAAEVNELKRRLGKGHDEELEKKIATAESELEAAATYDDIHIIHDTDSHIGITNTIESLEEFRQKLKAYADLKKEYSEKKDEPTKRKLLDITQKLFYGDTPSSLEIVRRVGRYIEDNVKIDEKTTWLLTGDEITGASFPGANEEYGVTISRAESYLAAVRDSGLSSEEKSAFTEALLKRVLESIPVTKLSKQWQIYREVKVPMLEAARKKGATINVAGGNHPAKSTSARLYTEPVDITNMLSDFKGSHLNKVRYPEEGTDEAELWWEEKGATFFAGHKPAGHSGDFAQKMMEHFNRSPKGLAAAFFGHYHRDVTAFKDGVIYSMGQGKHTGGHYCDMTGVAYGTHGINELWFDPQKPGHFRKRIITDNPLKKYAELPINPVKLAMQQ